MLKLPDTGIEHRVTPSVVKQNRVRVDVEVANATLVGVGHELGCVASQQWLAPGEVRLENAVVSELVDDVAPLVPTQLASRHLSPASAAHALEVAVVGEEELRPTSGRTGSPGAMCSLIASWVKNRARRTLSPHPATADRRGEVKACHPLALARRHCPAESMVRPCPHQPGLSSPELGKLATPSARGEVVGGSRTVPCRAFVTVCSRTTRTVPTCCATSVSTSTGSTSTVTASARITTMTPCSSTPTAGPSTRGGRTTPTTSGCRARSTTSRSTCCRSSC